MSAFLSWSQATRLAFAEKSFSVFLADGRILNVPLAFFPRLLNADQGQREHYALSGGGTGIHWDDLDEDISVEGLLLGVNDRTHVHPVPSRNSAQTEIVSNIATGGVFKKSIAMPVVDVREALWAMAMHQGQLVVRNAEYGEGA